MKRRIIQHSPTSLVVTIPSEWIKRNHLHKGDEVDVQLYDDELLISNKEKKITPLEAEVDISKLDRTTITHILRNLYRAGYDKITIKFEKEKIPYERFQDAFLATEIIHQELRALLGYEITRERKNICIIENISEGITEEIPTIFRRIHLLLIDIAEVLYDAVSRNDSAGIRTVKDKHETIIRFINYCLRIGTKTSGQHSKLTYSEYHHLANLDRVVHFLRRSAIHLLGLEKKVSKELIEIIGLTVESLKLLNKFLYTKKSIVIRDMNNIRYSVEGIMIKKHDLPKLDSEEVMVFFHMRNIHHFILDICDVRGL